MREILFRGKTKNGEWKIGDLIREWYGETPYIHWFEYSSLALSREEKVIPETVGQFTGLTDKNGKKIFEGDIVKCVYIEKRDFQGIKYDSEHELIEQIVYSEQNACFMLKIDCQGIPMYRHLSNNNELVKIKELEVIGNVFDNVELLNEN